jgi:hypothetical protein
MIILNLQNLSVTGVELRWPLLWGWPEFRLSPELSFGAVRRRCFGLESTGSGRQPKKAINSDFLMELLNNWKYQDRVKPQTWGVVCVAFTLDTGCSRRWLRRFTVRGTFHHVRSDPIRRIGDTPFVRVVYQLRKPGFPSPKVHEWSEFLRSSKARVDAEGCFWSISSSNTVASLARSRSKAVFEGKGLRIGLRTQIGLRVYKLLRTPCTWAANSRPSDYSPPEPTAE